MDKYECECGSVIKRKSLSAHFKTKKHLSFVITVIECDICCITQSSFFKCQTCRNSYCMSCHVQLRASSCPFCRSAFSVQEERQRQREILKLKKAQEEQIQRARQEEQIQRAIPEEQIQRARSEERMQRFIRIIREGQRQRQIEERQRQIEERRVELLSHVRQFSQFTDFNCELLEQIILSL